MNSKDLNLINRLPELKAAGVFSLKIEGRAKSAYYVGVVTNAYRIAIDEFLKFEGDNFQVSSWVKKELEKVSHRPYFEGFLHNKPNLGSTQSQNYKTGGYVRKCDVVAVAESFDGVFLNCVQKNKFNVGDCLEILIPKRNPERFVVEQMKNEDGEEILSAPHAHMKVLVKCRCEVNLEKSDVKGCFLRRDVK